ncbi:unnamed protein product, partial [Porites evermanni]
LLFAVTIHEHSIEKKVIDLAANDSSAFKNVSVLLKRVSHNDNITLLNQASVFVQEDVIALIEGNHINKSDTCALSAVTGIPVISLSRDTRPIDECTKSVQMHPGYKTFAHATLDILNTFQWEKIALLYDADGLLEAGYFYFISQGSELTVTFVPIPEKQKVKDKTKLIATAMNQIEKLELDVILLYTKKENVELFLKQKRCENMKGYKWILRGQVPGNLSSRPVHVVLTFKLPYNEKLAPKELLSTNYSQKELAAIAHDAMQVIKQTQKIESCLSINCSAVTSKDRETLFSCMTKVTFDGVTGPVRFSQDGKRAGAQLEILNLRNGSFRKVGSWNSSEKAVMFENIHPNMYDAEKFTGSTLEGKILRVVVSEDEPFVMLKRQEDGLVAYEGYCIDLLNELAKTLHFTYNIKPPPDGFFGVETINGSWNGMIGELLNKRADISGALTITEGREKVVDFAVPFMYFTEDMLLKKTSFNNGSIDFLKFLNPFHSDVWFASLATLVVISVSNFVINYLSPYGYKGANGRGTSEEFSFFNSVWFALACMLQQGSENQPRSLSGRILTGCYWFCILVWVSTYTANLAAFLTVKNAVAPINNLDDVIASSYQVTTLDSGSIYEFFKTSKYQTHRQIWHRIQAGKSFVRNVNEAVQLIREKDDRVFIYDGPVIRHIANKPPCDLTTVPGLTNVRGISLAFQANDPYVTDFTLAILRFQENGFLGNLERKWWESSSGCPKEQDTVLSRKRIDLTSMAGVYVVLGIGLVVAYLVLIAEIIWKRK